MVSVFLVAPALILGSGFTVLGLITLPPVSRANWALAYVLHASLSGAYMFLYTGVTGFSPSIAILENVARSMPHGLGHEQLAPDWFNDDQLSGRRHHNLLAGGLISESAGRLHLSIRGRLIAWSFLVFRRFLGLPDVAKG